MNSPLPIIVVCVLALSIISGPAHSQSVSDAEWTPEADELSKSEVQLRYEGHVVFMTDRLYANATKLVVRDDRFWAAEVVAGFGRVVFVADACEGTKEHWRCTDITVLRDGMRLTGGRGTVNLRDESIDVTDDVRTTFPYERRPGDSLNPTVAEPTS